MWYIIFLSVAVCLGSRAVYGDVHDATLSFSVEMMQKMHEKEEGNAIASPVSLSVMLAMLQQGAGGNTKQQLDQALHADGNTTREFYHNLTRHYQRSGQLLDIDFSSKMFIKMGFDVLPPYKALLVDDFRADIESLDFIDREATVQHINSWVSESTHNHITELFQQDQLKPDSMLVLVNAVFFKSYFDHSFWSQNTKNRTFSPSPSEELQVPTMHQREYYKAGQSSELGAKWLHLNFEGNDDYTLLLVLPTERHQLNKLKKLTKENWSSIFTYDEYKDVNVSIPKFSLKKETELITLLKSLGVEDIFENVADLPGITGQRIKVTDFLQKATFDVDEKGVTASAATGIIAEPVSALFIPNAQEMEFTADQPFLVFIIDHIHGIPLFAGRVLNPLNE